MKISADAKYPAEGMSLIYDAGINEVFQLVFYSEDFGIFTRLDGRWRAFVEEDESMNDLATVDVLPEDYKTVRDMFDAAQLEGKMLTFDEIEPYAVVYSFEEEEDAQL